MTTPDAFRRAIWQEPGNDALRIALADWLKDQGRDGSAGSGDRSDIAYSVERGESEPMLSGDTAMSDELTVEQAAFIVRDFMERYPKGECGQDDGCLMMDAAVRLAAEHPADDGETIAEDWLRSIGAEWREDWMSWSLPTGDQCLTLFRSASEPGTWTLQYETDFCWPRGLVNRGDLRHLLARFGVTPSA